MAGADIGCAVCEFTFSLSPLPRPYRMAAVGTAGRQGVNFDGRTSERYAPETDRLFFTT